jgi:hypothetical protein
VHEDLLKKMLEVQKNMRHDIMNDIQVIYGYLQLRHPEKAMKYSIKAVERLQRYSQLGKIPLPFLQCFLTWFVSQLNNDGHDPFEFVLTGDWSNWRDEDQELTQLLMELFCSVQESLLNNTLQCKFSFTEQGQDYCLLFKGSEERMQQLNNFNFSSEKLSLVKKEVSPGTLLITIKKAA